MNTKWQLTDIPDLTGKVYLVTGGNTGLGLKSVEHLSLNGATVILTCRTKRKGIEAIEQINANPNSIDVIELDLINPASIRTCAELILSKYQKLDGLINNAGVVNLEHLQHTPDGHEMHMATNHYGHFLLTGLLFKLLCDTPNSRVVTVTSGGYKAGEIRFDDINWLQRDYSRMKAYGDSKLANLLFTHKLQEKFDQAGASTLSVAAHPGLTATPRQQSIGVGGRLSKCLASDMNKGVAHQLYAALAPDVKKLDFYGPKFGIWGAPTKWSVNKTVLDKDLANKLWQFTEEVTHYSY